MLYETDVVTFVVKYLQEIGYSVESACYDYTSGHDIIASKGDQRLFVEAKGEGSQDENTRRYGKSFTTTQVLDHVAKAWLKCSQAMSEEHDPETVTKVAIAVPDNHAHRYHIGKILPVMMQTGACVFWVQADGSVVVDGSL